MSTLASAIEVFCIRQAIDHDVRNLAMVRALLDEVIDRVVAEHEAAVSGDDTDVAVRLSRVMVNLRTITSTLDDIPEEGS